MVPAWRSESGSNFDKNLREITLSTKDAFEPQLPLSVVVHIDYRKAPIAKQKELTGSLVDISIKENQGAASVKAAEKRRQEIEALAQAERFRQEMEGSGRASAIRAVGEAEAAAIHAKSEAMQGEGADKQLTQTVMLLLAEAFEAAKVPLVPQVQMGGTDSNAFSTLLELMSAIKAVGAAANKE